MKHKFFSFSILFLGLTIVSICQENEVSTNKALDYYNKTDTGTQKLDSNTVLQLDNRYPKDLDLLTSAYWEKKKNYGYKIQIFSGKSRWEANKVRSKLINDYENKVSAEVVYQAPNFKVRVGNHRNRLSATQQLLELKPDHPGAFIVKDEIKTPHEARKEKD